MERDFLGLKSNSKDPIATVKEEAVDDDGCKDSGFTKGPGTQWPFPNKVTNLPHLMAFKAAQGRSACEIQMFPVANQVFPAHTSNPFIKNHFAANQNMAGASMKQQLIGATSHANPPVTGSFVGNTELWNHLKPSGSPAQLTIFYAGTVRVYDDISPEKAQAIMYLARNGSASSSKANAKPHVEEPKSKLGAGDVVAGNASVVMSPSSALSSSLSQNGAQSGSGSTSTDELVASKPRGLPATPVSKVDSPKLVNGIGSVSAVPMMASAVPQARKASLARFLEKRKERVMSAAPYICSKKLAEGVGAEINGSNSSTTSAPGSAPQNRESSHD